MKKAFYVIILILVSNIIKAQINVIPKIQISSIEFNIDKQAIPINTIVSLNYTQIDFQGITIVDTSNNDIINKNIQFIACPPIPTGLSFTVVQFDFVSFLDGVYYIKGYYNGNPIYIKVTVIN